MLHTVATLRGRRLDFGATSRAEWYTASRESMPTRRNGTVDHQPFVPLLGRVLG
jgi:cell filamentation protein